MTRLVLILPLLMLPLTNGCTQPITTRPVALTPGDHLLGLEVDGLARSYLVHIPPRFDAKAPTPVVLAFHLAFTNGETMANFCGLNRKADAAGFVTVYPNGTGCGNAILFWNAGYSSSSVDDVRFVDKLLDDLATIMNVDSKRVFATGMSNGGFMCYRLAAELSDRIAAIAPVGGTLAIKNPKPRRPVSVIHFHGSADTFVPVGGPNRDTLKDMKFLSVDDTVKAWAKLNGCSDEPNATTMPDKAKDGTTVTQRVYGPGKDGAEVVLFTIEGGGHTWPGQKPTMLFIGKSTMNISANDLIWDFFQKHSMK